MLAIVKRGHGFCRGRTKVAASREFVATVRMGALTSPDSLRPSSSSICSGRLQAIPHRFASKRMTS